jgi:hypothetical protein
MYVCVQALLMRCTVAFPGIDAGDTNQTLQ